MFGISNDKKDSEEKTDIQEEIPKFAHPKIIMFDFPKRIVDAISTAGYNVISGTFGSPYKVEQSKQYQPVIGVPQCPNCSEQEIIFIDLTSPKILDSPTGKKRTPNEENDFWAKCNFGNIDPRPKFMGIMQKDFDRILKHGGIFVIFAQPRSLQKLVWAKVDYSELKIKEKVPWDNWSFLSVLSPDYLQIEADHGEEIKTKNQSSPIYKFLSKNINKGEYFAKFSPRYNLKDNWVSLSKNKYKEDVSGAIISDDFNGKILILPQINKTPEIILSFLTEVLADLSPELFPHLEGAKWVEKEAYELDSVQQFKKEKIIVQKKAEDELQLLEEKINKEREELGWMHGILTKTGDELVKDVQKCLDFLCFKEVVDADAQIDGSKPKQEDLQIHERSPVLLIEVKGISGLPDEEEVLQVVKYIPRRMKEWDRRDVNGVSLINHQKHIPALDRNNENVFTKQQIEDAEAHDITLITTWDLFILIKGMIKYEWDPEVIKDLFYEKGRISNVPSNYKPIGEIFTYIKDENIIGIKINNGKLYKGQRIGYRLPNKFLEEEVTSLQLNNQDFNEVHSDQSAGIKTIYSKDELKIGLTVYEII